ncbi:MAG: hypothetical protein TR69_WS6001000319 [candidate division WS6 bacterium OLB20]|uniref:DUF2000 domain-containing protein n=1 Tax=candidate division WS6 bacterium OLB20 TaxID=1617426 RepID=A0A136M0L7_9BACT|nr:MAG: hypothetical protein TR69_WS6001000319 [candidate division WS6 bacterium OLB20]
MAPTFGYGHSERVFWFLEDVTAREGVPFPQLKFLVSDDTRKIYPEIDFDMIRNPQEDASDTRSQDTDSKFVIVLREGLEEWQRLNTIGHITALLGSELGHNNMTTRARFELAGDATIKANSQYPIIVMKAKSATQLFNLLEKAEQQKVEIMPYVMDMIEHNLDEPLARSLSQKQKQDLDYLGIGLFGNSRDIDTLTKKFSLWK